MPNWCFVTLEIETKSKKDLDEILDAIKGDGEQYIDFNKIVPQDVNDPEYQCDPKVSHIQPNERNPNFDWYAWNREHWGTKWNACDCQEPEKDGGTAIVRFMTAWDFPEPVMEALAKKFPGAKIVVDFWNEEDGCDEDGTPHKLCRWTPRGQ